MMWRISLLIEPDEDEFHGFCPFLKGLHVGGETKEETLMHIGDALSGYMRSIIKHGDKLDFEKVKWYSLEEVKGYLRDAEGYEYGGDERDEKIELLWQQVHSIIDRIDEKGYSQEEIERDIADAIRAVREATNEMAP